MIAGAAALGIASQLELLDVRFGSKPDIEAPPTDVRFTPENGHQEALLGRPLCAINGHQHS
jgi:hypothetical protein